MVQWVSHGLEVRKSVVGVRGRQPRRQPRGRDVELRRLQNLVVVVEVERLDRCGLKGRVLEHSSPEQVSVDVAVDRRVGIEVLEQPRLPVAELVLVLGPGVGVVGVVAVVVLREVDVTPVVVVRDRVAQLRPLGRVDYRLVLAPLLVEVRLNRPQ